MACETLDIDKIRCYCYPIWKFFWIGWVMARRIEPGHLYYDDTPCVTMHSEEGICYATIGFTKNGVMKRLRKYVASICEEGDSN